MSDNTPAKFITVWTWHYDESALYILCKVNANSNKLLEKFEPHSFFRLQYQLFTMTTFFEIIVYRQELSFSWSPFCRKHYGVPTCFSVIRLVWNKLPAVASSLYLIGHRT